MASFDGTSKSSEGKGQSIKYWEITTPFMQDIRRQVLSKASPEAIQYLDPEHYAGPTVVCDASLQTNEEWLRERQNSIGSSEVSNIFGESPYPHCTNLDLFYKKRGVAPLIEDDAEDAERRERNFLYGHLMEEYLHLVTRQMFPGARLIIDTNTYAAPKMPFVTANLDAMMQLSDGSFVHVEYKTAGVFGEEAYANGAIPPHYKRQLIQCQHIMGVYVSYLIVAFSRDNIIVRRYVRDLDEEMEQVIATEEFWTKNVLAGIEPQPLGPVSNVVDTVKRFSGYADKKLPAISLEQSLWDTVKDFKQINDEIKKVNAQLKILQKRKDEMTVPLAMAMGQNTKAYIDDGQTAYEISFAPRAGARKCDFDRLALNRPDIYAEYVTQKEEGSRPMSIKEVAVRN